MLMYNCVNVNVELNLSSCIFVEFDVVQATVNMWRIQSEHVNLYLSNFLWNSGISQAISMIHIYTKFPHNYFWIAAVLAIVVVPRTTSTGSIGNRICRPVDVPCSMKRFRSCQVAYVRRNSMAPGGQYCYPFV